MKYMLSYDTRHVKDVYEGRTKFFLISCPQSLGGILGMSDTLRRPVKKDSSIVQLKLDQIMCMLNTQDDVGFIADILSACNTYTVQINRLCPTLI
jgi:hypothetical protein